MRKRSGKATVLRPARRNVQAPRPVAQPAKPAAPRPAKRSGQATVLRPTPRPSTPKPQVNSRVFKLPDGANVLYKDRQGIVVYALPKEPKGTKAAQNEAKPSSESEISEKGQSEASTQEE